MHFLHKDDTAQRKVQFCSLLNMRDLNPYMSTKIGNLSGVCTVGYVIKKGESRLS